MARPSKYNPELVKRIAQYITDGLTIRDACYGVGITEDTFCRWRREKPEFAKIVNDATAAQGTWSSVALAQTSDYRRYTRKQKQCQKQQRHINTHLESENAPEGPLRKPQGYFENEVVSPSFDIATLLPARTEPPTNDFDELVYSKPYYNSTTDKVEWVEKEMYGHYVLHRCSVERWVEMLDVDSFIF